MKVNALALLILVLATSSSTRCQVASNAYPNEIPHLQLYSASLTSIIPLVSRMADVERVLGRDTTGKRIGPWSVVVYSVGKGGTCNGKPMPEELVGAVSSIKASPVERISLAEYSFPAAFSVSRVYVTHSPGPFDVYTDEYGLAYWICTKDTETIRKGDLWCVEYKAPPDLERRLRGC